MRSWLRSSRLELGQGFDEVNVEWLAVNARVGKPMKEPGLDGRHRDKATPKRGEIQQKRGDTLNKTLPKPIPQFRADTKLETMRKATGETSVEKVRRAAARLRK
jgi:hypothetical protein